jgi:para-nitrobenzyl esterase
MNDKPRRPDPATLRQTASGPVIGSIEPDGTHAWRGIRYAAPPVGALRWRAPQPPQPWTDPLEATAHGAMAPQVAGLLAPVPRAQFGQVVGAEDCLTLNVFAPARASHATPPGASRQPVMVWIHGGGNAVGTAASYDVARNLAAEDGVVVVTVNYRLGVLGWFTHPALQDDPAVTPEERSGNFALLDLVAALRWVRENIAAFGGDPDCVTIFGESAGGQNVLLLLASPLARGLFHRAIAQSPVAESFALHDAVHGADSLIESHRQGALRVAERLGAPSQGTADFLRSLSPAQLIGAFATGSVGIYLAPRPARDGVTLPVAPLAEVFAGGDWNRVPVILGTNRDEMRTFLADKPEHSRLLFGQIPLLHDRAAYLAESGFQSRAWRALHVDAMADAMLAGGHADTWTYRFDWDEAPRVPWLRPDLSLGAAHAMEMAFAFRDRAGAFDLFKVNTPFNRAGRMELVQAMGDAWTSFARSGAPTLRSISWPRRGLGVGADSLVFDTVRDGGLRLARLRTDLAALKRELFGAPLPPALVARIYARVFVFAPLFVGHGSAAEYAQWCTALGVSEAMETHRPRLEI